MLQHRNTSARKLFTGLEKTRKSASPLVSAAYIKFTEGVGGELGVGGKLACSFRQLIFRKSSLALGGFHYVKSSFVRWIFSKNV